MVKRSRGHGIACVIPCCSLIWTRVRRSQVERNLSVHGDIVRYAPKPFEHCTWVEKVGMFPREVTKNILNPEDHNGSQIWVMRAYIPSGRDRRIGNSGQS